MTQHAAKWSYMGHFCFQTELMVEIYTKSQIRAIGKVLLMKIS